MAAPITPDRISADGGTIRKGDGMVVRRESETIRAKFAGQLFVPETTAADAGKQLYVDASGEAVWRDTEVRVEVIASRTASHFPLRQKHVADRNFTGYLAFTLEMAATYGGRNRMLLPAVMNADITGDRTLGNTYYLRAANRGWVSLRLTGAREFMLDGLAQGEEPRIWRILGLAV